MCDRELVLDRVYRVELVVRGLTVTECRLGDRRGRTVVVALDRTRGRTVVVVLRGRTVGRTVGVDFRQDDLLLLDEGVRGFSVEVRPEEGRMLRAGSVRRMIGR